MGSHNTTSNDRANISTVVNSDDRSVTMVNRVNISTVVNSDGQSLWPINFYIYTLVTV